MSHIEAYKMLNTCDVSEGIDVISPEQEERRLSGLMKK